MAKTSTRSKPATAKKTEATGSATPDGVADIRRGFCRKLLGSFVCWLILRHGSQTSKQQGVSDVG